MDQGRPSQTSKSAIAQSSNQQCLPGHHRNTTDHLVSMLLEDTFMEAEDDEEESSPRPKVPFPPRLSSAQTMPSLSNLAYADEPIPRPLNSNNDNGRATQLSPGAGTPHRLAYFGQNNTSPGSANFSRPINRATGIPVPTENPRRHSAHPENANAQPKFMKPVVTSTDHTDDAGTHATNIVIFMQEDNEKRRVAREAKEAEEHEPRSSQFNKEQSRSRLEEEQKPKKRRLLPKFKNTIKKPFKVRDDKKLDESREDARVLVATVNEVPDQNEELSCLQEAHVSMIDIATNEARNIETPKIRTPNTIPRKPISNKGESSSVERSLESSPFEASLQEDRGTSYINSSAGIEERNIDSRSSSFKVRGSKSCTDVSNSSSREHTSNPQFRQRVPTSVDYEHTIDGMLSSSPADQSTPRIRLEPTECSNRRTLRHVPTSSPSLFNAERMNVDNGDLADDSSFVRLRPASDIARLNVNHQYPADGSAYTSQPREPLTFPRRKKHPTPEANLLGGWEEVFDGMQEFSKPAANNPGSSLLGHDLLENFRSRPAPSASILHEGYINSSIRRHERNDDMTKAPGITRSVRSMPAIDWHRRRRGVVLTQPETDELSRLLESKEPAQTEANEISKQLDSEEDELAWDDSKYNIARKRS